MHFKLWTNLKEYFYEFLCYHKIISTRGYLGKYIDSDVHPSFSYAEKYPDHAPLILDFDQNRFGGAC